jgi:hypothetical protein
MCQLCFLKGVMGLFDHVLNWVLVIFYVLDACTSADLEVWVFLG